MAQPLSTYRAITMDCYGTLIDWESGIWNAFQPLLASNGADPARASVLQTFARLESAQQAATFLPFSIGLHFPTPPTHYGGFGSYKPSAANFEYMLADLTEKGHSPSTDILHVAQSLFHDHSPATAFGLDRVWIDRQPLSEGGDWERPLWSRSCLRSIGRSGQWRSSLTPWRNRFGRALSSPVRSWRGTSPGDRGPISARRP